MKRNTRGNFVLKPSALALALLLTHAGVQAQVTEGLDLVVVSAKPIIDSNNVDSFSALSTRITEQQVRDLGALSLPDALRMTPGVQISLYDAVGNYSGNQGGNIYIRGTGTSRPGGEIKTYLDGLPVYMGLWNHPLMDLLPLNALQSIDVSKGPQPMVSGNNLGAVNLQTASPAEPGIHGQAGVSIGSYNTRIAQARLSGRTDVTDFVVAVGSADSDGHRSNGDARLRNALGKLQFRFSDAWSLGLSYLHVENRVGDPGDQRYPTTTAAIGPYQSNGVGRNDSAMDMVSAVLSHGSEALSGEFKVYSSTGRNNLVNDANWGTFNSHFDMTGWRWQERLKVGQGTEVLAGVDYDNIRGSIAGPNAGAAVGTPFAFGKAGSVDVPSFRITSPYLGLSHTFQLDGWTLQPSVGVRGYDSNVHASSGAPNAGLNMKSDNLTLFANYSVGIVYPGAETYALPRALPMAFSANNGWSTLAPTREKHSEAGFKWDASPTTHVEFTAFQDDVSDRYVWSGFNVMATGVWSNSGQRYRIRGMEASVRQDLGRDWVVFAGLTKLNASMATLPFAPKTAVSLGLNGKLGAVSMAFDAQYQSRMFSQTWDRSVAVANEEVGGFAVANARVAYALPALGKKGDVFVSINNLFDKHYAYNTGYPMPERNIRVGMNASF